MPLSWQNVKVPFGGGLDTKTDHKQVIPGKLLTLENGVFHETGNIKKRNGFETPYSLVTADGETITAGTAIYRRGKELLIAGKRVDTATGRISWEDGRVMLSYEPDRDEWMQIGTREPLSLEVETINRPTLQWLIPDVALAESNKYACYVWVGAPDPADAAADFYHGHVTIIERANDVIVVDNHEYDYAPLAANDVMGIHVVGIDGTNDIFNVWMAVPDENDIYLSQIDTASLQTIGAPTLKIDDLHEDMVWDVCYADHSDDGPCSVVAYKDTGGGYKVKWFDQTGALVDTQASITLVKNAITVFQVWDRLTLTNKVFVAFQESTTHDIIGISFNANATLYSGAEFLVLALNDYVVRNLTGCKDTAADHYNWATKSNVRIYVEIGYYVGGFDAFYNNYIMQTSTEIDGTGSIRLNNMQACCLASKAWEHESKARVWVVHNSSGLLSETPDVYSSTMQDTYFLRSTQGEGTVPGGGNYDELDRTDARCLGGEAGGASWNQSISAVVSPETDKYLFAGLRRDVIIGVPDSQYTGNTLDSVVGITTTFGVTTQPSTELGPCIQTGGGFVGCADGRFQELGFHLHPVIRVITAAGGSSGVPAEWQYCVIYEWTDREGQIHRSAPSIPVTVNAANNDDHVVVYASCLNFGDPHRLRDIRLVLYRTVHTGTVFYRLPIFVHQLNDPDITVIALHDTLAANPAWADASLADGEMLYTTGEVVENICPPASSIMNVRQDRALLVPDEDRTALWYSKIKQFAVGTSFNDSFVKRIDDGGPITALAEMDTREIVFKEAQIRAFSGDGPNDLGTQGTFTEDYLITSDVGCCDRASVVWTDKGIMFKSLKGIYMLGRNLQVSYVGAPVEDFNQYTVLKAELVETKNQVRFLLEGAQMLVYDYLMNQWSVFKAPQSGEVELFWDTVDSAMWQNQYVMIQDDGTVHLEGTDFTDNTAYIPMTMETAWIKLSGLQGYQRVRWASFLGEVYGQTVLTIETFRDYVDTVLQTSVISVGAAFAAAPPAQVRVKPKFQKCEAIKFKISDALQAGWIGTQEGYSMAEIMLEVGLKKGVMRQGSLKSR